MQRENREEQSGPVMQRDENGLFLAGGGQKLRADFTKLLPRIRPDNLHRELLVRAARIKGTDGNPTAVDATAGLGEDAFLLAAAGYTVQLFERDPIIAALLLDALERAQSDPALCTAAGRMSLTAADSITALHTLGQPPDLIYLDPMFPARQKSALVKKKFQMLQQLELPCEEEEALLDAAIAAGPRRIVIKRPLKGPYLSGRKPDFSLKGKAIRYDCILLPGKV